ncbi:acyltransferase family protein [Massilia horti]|uniref:Acyltransferase n=1 Tax=Massilia horti TaxID=2562153 RepID=A0A4Y9T6M9_9BURK|nr:acyltransferase family protein [Massilia horti]TFW34549.1 acyltransferase [Massilia horti]
MTVPAQPGYRPDIDGLRAVAVLSVVLYHGWPHVFAGGFIGVDVFFVISGYLITSIIIAELERGRFTLAGFYARRIRRIFPALLLVLAATAGFGWYVLLGPEFRQAGRHVAAGGAFVSNLLLWSEAGYFDNAAATKPLLHLWSLGIEEQFYLLWPLLLWLVHRRARNFLFLIGLVFLLSMGANLALAGSDATAAFYSPASRFWELMAGGIGAHLHLRRQPWGPRVRTQASIAGALLLAAGLVLIRPHDPFPGTWALLPVAGAFLLIMAGPAAPLNRLLGRRLAVGIGVISYPLYLWHWPLLSFGYILNGDKPPWQVRVALVAASFVLAFLTWALVERPLRHRAPRARLVTGLAGGMLAAVLAGVLVGAGAIRERIDARGAETYLDALNDSDFPGPGFAPYRYQGVLFEMVRSQAPGITLFLGDSVVQQYGPYIEATLAAQPRSYRSVMFATAGNCPPIPHAYPLPMVRNALCQPTVRAGYAFAARPEVDTVVIGAAWYGYFLAHSGGLLFDDGRRQLEFPDPAAMDAAYQALEQAIRDLRQRGKRVFLLLQPAMGPAFDPRNMITGSRLGRIRPLARIEPVRLDRFLADNAGPHERLSAIARRAGAELIDPTRFLCADNACPVLGPDGAPVYTDTMHMRPAYSRAAAGYLARTIAREPAVAQQ